MAQTRHRSWPCLVGRELTDVYDPPYRPHCTSGFVHRVGFSVCLKKSEVYFLFFLGARGGYAHSALLLLIKK